MFFKVSISQYSLINKMVISRLIIFLLFIIMTVLVKKGLKAYVFFSTFCLIQNFHLKSIV